MIKRLCIALTIFHAAAASAQERRDMTATDLQPVIEFTDTAAAGDWFIVNDGVMGGRSQSSMTVGDTGGALFAGKVSLENNGGFASTRTVIPDQVMAGCDAVIIRVQGDGRVYQFRLRTDAGFDGLAYRREFGTVDGKWQEITLPFSDFVPSFRGKVVEDAGTVDPSRIRQIGFLIADKQSGPFALQIDWIRARPIRETGSDPGELRDR